MFQNYFRVAVRNLFKNRLYSVINITGLAVGLAACILISLFVRDELSYDQHWSNASQLHRLHTTFAIPGREPFVTVIAQGPAREALLNYFPQDVAAATRFTNFSAVISYDNKSFNESIHFTDPDTASMFDFDVLDGDMQQALQDNSSLAINRSFAMKHFGTVKAVGEVVTFNLYEIQRDYRIGAVFADLPHNTVLDFQALTMIDEGDWSSRPHMFNQWFTVNNTVYFQLRDNSDINTIDSRLEAFANANISIPAGAISDKEENASDFVFYSTMPITEIQLNPVGLGEMKPTGNKMTVTIFAAIAAMILLIACINFMNLSTSKSTQRAREVALRKVMGARRDQLVLQFLGESILLALIGLLLGLVLVELALPVYSDFLNRQLDLSYSDGITLGILAILVGTVGLLGGVYPALVLSGFRPAWVLKANKTAESSGSALLRNILVVFQFTVSISLIVATATVYGQMLYATNMDPGFNKDQLLSLHGMDRPGAASRQEAIRQKILTLPGVTHATLSSEAPFSSDESNQSVSIPGNPEAGSIIIGTVSIDYYFLETLQIPLLAGRNYSRDYALDAYPVADDLVEGETGTGNMLLNKGALARLGFGTPEQALGRQIELTIGGSPANPVKGLFTIVGVVPDIHFQSLKSVKRPEIYFTNRSPAREMLIRYEGDPVKISQQIEALWNSIIPDVPLTYDFADDIAAEEFAQETNTASMLGMFSLLAIVVACLGLYGLASFTAERRTKEIGIRKVLGASVSAIVGLLLWQFSKPVLLANLLAWPIAIWGMVTWLENFPYRLDTWLLLPMCLLAGFIALLISWLTVGGNAARVARSNPIQALRYE